jgi:hypothetical protein
LGSLGAPKNWASLGHSLTLKSKMLHSVSPLLFENKEIAVCDAIERFLRSAPSQNMIVSEFSAETIYDL